MLVELFYSIRKPCLSSFDVYPWSTTDKSVQVVVSLKVDRFFNKRCLQIPDLMVCNILDVSVESKLSNLETITYQLHSLEHTKQSTQSFHQLARTVT